MKPCMNMATVEGWHVMVCLLPRGHSGAHDCCSAAEMIDMIRTRGLCRNGHDKTGDGSLKNSRCGFTCRACAVEARARREAKRR